MVFASYVPPESDLIRDWSVIANALPRRGDVVKLPGVEELGIDRGIRAGMMKFALVTSFCID